MISQFASANENINSLLDDIKYFVNNESQSTRTVLRVEKQLERTLSLLTDGSTTTPVPVPRTAQVELSCISRDNDGMGPYVVNVKNLQTLQTNRVTDILFSSLVACDGSLQSSVVTRIVASMCKSRDNDGLGPYVRIILDLNDFTVVKDSVHSTMDECLSI
jgi:hypothetical protein